MTEQTHKALRPQLNHLNKSYYENLALADGYELLDPRQLTTEDTKSADLAPPGKIEPF